MRSQRFRSRSKESSTTRRGLAWLVVLASLSVASSACAFGPKKRPPQPEREVCFVGEYSCACYDPRFDSAPPGTTPISCDEDGRLQEKSSGNGACYLRPFALCRNYQAYSPADYDALQEWVSGQCFGPRETL
jgi:hypothetical protein